MAQLILVRHGLTDWNKEGKWHGITDISLNEEGQEESQQDGEAIKDLQIDLVYTSNLIRTQQTFNEINKILHLECPVYHAPELNERDYGIYTGKNKWQIKEELGEEQFTNMRRGWNFPIPEGETLKDVYQRVVPFYQDVIIPKLKSGQNVMIVSSGNTLRALVKYLENISEEKVPDIELGFGEIYVYTVDQSGTITDKQIRVQGYIPQAHWFKPEYK